MTPAVKQLTTILSLQLKDIKKRLPNTCSFLATIKTIDGGYLAVSKVGGEEFRYTLPYNLQMTQADVEELHNQILEECHKVK